MIDPSLDPIWIDVGKVLQRTVASLYSNLVTRPTGRAVRMAIETQLQTTRARSLSLIDLSEVVIIDFSCADEVVAKLLIDSRERAAHEAFFVFRGVHEPHRDQIEAVLERRRLAAVAETEPGTYRLLGQRTPEEDRVWAELEVRGLVGPDQVEQLTRGGHDRLALESLLDQRLAFRSPTSGRIHALSRLVQHLT